MGGGGGGEFPTYNISGTCHLFGGRIWSRIKIIGSKFEQDPGKVCTISFERPVNYLCDAWHVFPPKYEAWTHFNRP